jgi:hypothetical protein
MADTVDSIDEATGVIVLSCDATPSRPSSKHNVDTTEESRDERSDQKRAKRCR